VLLGLDRQIQAMPAGWRSGGSNVHCHHVSVQVTGTSNQFSFDNRLY